MAGRLEDASLQVQQALGEVEAARKQVRVQVSGFPSVPVIPVGDRDPGPLGCWSGSPELRRRPSCACGPRRGLAVIPAGRMRAATSSADWRASWGRTLV